MGMYRDTCMPWIETTTACSSCGVDTESNDMLCDQCDAYADNEAEEAEQMEMEEQRHYDRPDVIAGEVFQDKLDMYRNEH